MKDKFLICICIIIALAMGTGHVVQAKGADSQNVSTWISQKDPTGSAKSTGVSSKKTENKQAKDAVTESTNGASTFLMFVKLIFSLAIILGLIYLLYRVVGKRTKAYRTGGAIKNIGGVSVGANRSVQLIRIGEEVLVVGVGDSVNLIKEITDPETVLSLSNQESEGTDLVQKNVSKVVHWVKDGAAKVKLSGVATSGVAKTFDHELKQLLKKRTHDVEEQLGKDTDDDTRNSN